MSTTDEKTAPLPSSTTTSAATASATTTAQKPSTPALELAVPEKIHVSETCSTLTTTTTAVEKGGSGMSTPRSYRGGDPFETDLEAIITAADDGQGSGHTPRRKSTTQMRTDCQVWPGQDHWKQKAKAAKIRRAGCNCLARLSKRNRIIVKVLLVLLIVGIAVGVGVGISKPLNAPIWGDGDRNLSG